MISICMTTEAHQTRPTVPLYPSNVFCILSLFHILYPEVRGEALIFDVSRSQERKRDEGNLCLFI